jgi:lysine N6-hydroxylase
MMSDPTYDFAGIGIGPFNLGLACLTAPIKGLHGVFLDENEGFDWHPGMLLQDVRLQTPFLADLVTLADPTSPFSFLNYVKAQGRIYSFYIRENFFLKRTEYNQYCQWAAAQLPNLEFNTRVETVDYSDSDRCYIVRSSCTQSNAPKTHRARRLVLGVGSIPYVPSGCHHLLDRATHSSSYLAHKVALQSKRSITVLGSGQSAAEIFYDLLQDIDAHGYALHWITRSPRFSPMEYSKLTLEMTSPEYVDYFHELPAHQRDRLVRAQKYLYKGISDGLIHDIYDLLYTKRLSRAVGVSLRTNSELKRAAFDPAAGYFELELFQHEQERHYHHHTEGLILATGYTYRRPDFLKGIASRIRWDAQGRFDVRRNYSIDVRSAEIFVQNAELHTHGFVAPDLGMACYRNAHIIREMTGVEHYPLEQRIAFQQFGVPRADAAQPAIELGLAKA